MTDYKVLIEQTVPRERVADVLCGALEGGSTYWCDKFEPSTYPEGTKWGHEAVAAGARFKIWYDDESKIVPNSTRHMEQALKLLAEQYPRHFGDLMGETDDAETSDVLFQLICFGEVVYG